MDHFLNALESLIADERGRQAASGSRDADLFALATQHGGVEHVVAVLQRYGSLIARFPIGAENRPFDAGLLSMLNMIQPLLQSATVDASENAAKPSVSLQPGVAAGSAVPKLQVQPLLALQSQELSQEQLVSHGQLSLDSVGGQSEEERHDVAQDDTENRAEDAGVERVDASVWFFKNKDLPLQHWDGDNGLLARVGVTWEEFKKFFSVVGAAKNLVLPHPKAQIDFVVPENPELKELQAFARKAAAKLEFENLTGKASTKSLLGTAWSEWYQRIRSNATYGWKVREGWTSRRWTAWFFFKYLYASAKEFRDGKRTSKSGSTPGKKRARLAAAASEDAPVR